MNTEFYFTIYLTENEHYFVEDELRQYCDKHGLEMVYYRSFKTGHVPCQRECKIRGFSPRKFKDFKTWCDRPCGITLGNYWQEQKALTNNKT